jgi:hypothetical protein
MIQTLVVKKVMWLSQLFIGQANFSRFYKYKPCGTLLLQLVPASLPEVCFSYANSFSSALFPAHFWHTLAAYLSRTFCCKCAASILFVCKLIVFSSGKHSSEDPG